MIKSLCSLPASCSVLIAAGSLFLLSACTPTTAGPSSALKRQFAQMQQQQRQQAEQLAQIQQQLALLQPQTFGSTPPAGLEQPAQLSAPVSPAAEPMRIPASASQEVSALADSAANYLSAFSSLAAGRYSAAENGFNNFLASYPGHQYSPNARYWLASAQLSQGKLQQASSNLRQLLADRNGQKKPAALVLLAKVYQQQNLSNEADEVLEQLRSRYPESSEAQHFFDNAQPQQ